MRLAEPLFEHAQPRQIVGDDFDDARWQRACRETHEQAAAVLTPRPRWTVHSDGWLRDIPEPLVLGEAWWEHLYVDPLVRAVAEVYDVPLHMLVAPPRHRWSAHFTALEDGTILDHTPYLTARRDWLTAERAALTVLDPSARRFHTTEV